MNKIANSICKKIFFNQLKKIKYGSIVIVDGKNKYIFGIDKKFSCTIFVKNNNFYFEVITGGSIGTADSFIQNIWKTNNLTNVIRIMAINSELTENIESSFNLVVRPILRFLHYLKRNNKKNSLQNIAKHYDLSNEFFSKFLDSTMMYSSAIYNNKKDNLDTASVNKLKIICEKLKLKKVDHVIEIGSGWGGFAIYAATNYGCKVTTTTISKQQYLYTKNIINKLKLNKKIKVIFKDYRDLKGSFDKLVSIEMIEAVGHKYYDEYFAKVNSLLKDDGMALIQAITIRDQKYQAALKSVDFIQKYIFPGSCIPSLNILQNSITKSSNMIVKDIEDIGDHYATTLMHWRENFIKNLKYIESLGFDEKFIRMWLYYFAYCEGGFREKVINDAHILLAKPMNRDKDL
jgi:cyclopropane-fatty-acyl-phospholipid synthase